MQGVLSRLQSWKLDHKEEDVRGWAVQAPDGQPLGTVNDLVIDTDTKRVHQIVLRDGKRLPAHDLLVGNRVLVLEQGIVRRPAGTKTELTATKTTVRDEPVIATERPPARLAAAVPDIADLVVPIVDEEVEIGKRRVDTGSVHVETHVVSAPIDRDVSLREEHVKVERRRVDQPIAITDAEARFHDAIVEVTGKSEVPVVEKRAHVVEEIVINKQADEREVALRDTVRHTAADVTELPAAPAEARGARP
jgi:stress response protein YsnF